MDDNIIKELIDKIVGEMIIDDLHVIYPESFTVYETCLHPIKKENKND